MKSVEFNPGASWSATDFYEETADTIRELLDNGEDFEFFSWASKEPENITVVKSGNFASIKVEAYEICNLEEIVKDVLFNNDIKTEGNDFEDLMNHIEEVIDFKRSFEGVEGVFGDITLADIIDAADCLLTVCRDELSEQYDRITLEVLEYVKEIAR